jgi:hypothetical protein
MNPELEVVTCGGHGRIDGATVAVHPSVATDTWAALVPSPGSIPVAVRVVGVQDVAPEHVVVHEASASDLGIEGGRVRLDLRFPVQVLHSLCLETTLEEDLNEAVTRLRGDRRLTGTALFVGADLDDGSYLEVGGVPYRVRDLGLPAASSPCIAVVGDSTQLRLFAPGHRTGVDVVILADCSGSMSWDDIEDRSDALPGGARSRFRFRPSSGPRTITRTEALQRALSELLATRLRVDGRLSRIALVRFTTSASPHFPRAGAMTELHASSPQEVIDEFRESVSLLRAEPAATDIGQALYHAAELLHRHGRPGNERLVVLVSDGADWAPKGAEATGETVNAVDDPVSLMAHLHEHLGIRLHAIGIGREDDFHAWYRRSGRSGAPHASVVPNHRLLEELVRVGGGDPSRTGGLDVLEDYFGGLGGGTTREAGVPAREEILPVQAEVRDASLGAGRSLTDTERAGLESHKDRLFQLWQACNDRAQAVTGADFFHATPRVLETFMSRLHRPAVDGGRFGQFVLALHQTFWEAANEKLQIRRGQTAYPVPAIAKLANEQLSWLNDLRISYAHDPGITRSSSQQKAAERRAIRTAEIVAELTGQRVTPADDDARGWVAFQLSCIDRLAETLLAITAAFDAAHEEAKATDPAAGAHEVVDDDRELVAAGSFYYKD